MANGVSWNTAGQVRLTPLVPCSRIYPFRLSPGRATPRQIKALLGSPMRCAASGPSPDWLKKRINIKLHIQSPLYHQHESQRPMPLTGSVASSENSTKWRAKQAQQGRDMPLSVDEQSEVELGHPAFRNGTLYRAAAQLRRPAAPLYPVRWECPAVQSPQFRRQIQRPRFLELLRLM